MKALITGISGQDGSYLAELLLKEGYEVHGIVRRNSFSQNQTTRINHILNRVKLHYGDLLDYSSLLNIISEVKPHLIFNMAAQSHVQVSFENPIYTTRVNCEGFMNLLEATRFVSRDIRILQASSSEMFGNQIDEDGYQRETTLMKPVSPYGCSKLFSYSLARNYREAYGMFISNSICFNHESERRGVTFLPAKVCKGFADIKKGKIDLIRLGNPEAYRDWGYAPDYVQGMYKAITALTPADYVLATGVTTSVYGLCQMVFEKSGLLGIMEDYVCFETSKYKRPEELNILKGDASKIKNELGWEPEMDLSGILNEMFTYYLFNDKK